MIRDYFYRGYLGDGEKIEMVMHRHLFVELKNFLKVGFFGLFLPLFTWWLFPQIALFVGAWLTIGIGRFLFEFFDWYYDVWLVTNISIVEIAWQGFFEKSSSRIEYHTIQGIGYEVKGFWQTIGNYGSVVLEKFSAGPAVFEGAVSPKKKSELLTHYQEKFVANKSFRDHNALQSVLADLIQRHVVEHGLPQEQEQEE